MGRALLAWATLCRAGVTQTIPLHEAWSCVASCLPSHSSSPELVSHFPRILFMPSQPSSGLERALSPCPPHATVALLAHSVREAARGEKASPRPPFVVLSLIAPCVSWIFFSSTWNLLTTLPVFLSL